MDGVNVFYYGRADLGLIDLVKLNLHLFHNCVTLVRIGHQVGIVVRNCRNERFLCHGESFLNSVAIRLTKKTASYKDFKIPAIHIVNSYSVCVQFS